MRVHTQEKRAQEIAAAQVAREKAAKQAEYQHRANQSRRRDDDELMAMCGISSPRFSAPPSRR